MRARARENTVDCCVYLHSDSMKGWIDTGSVDILRSLVEKRTGWWVVGEFLREGRKGQVMACT